MSRVVPFPPPNWIGSFIGKRCALRRSSMSSLFADVFIPEHRMTCDECPHHIDTGRIVDDGQFNAAAAQELLFAEEGRVLADDDAGNAVEENGAAAHRAGRERRVEHGL